MSIINRLLSKRAFGFMQVFLAVTAYGVIVSPLVAQEASQQRRLAAEILWKILVKESDKLKLEGSASAPYDGFLKGRVDARAVAKVLDPTSNLSVQVPKFVQAGNQVKLRITITAPLAGNVTATAHDDLNNVIARGATDFRGRLEAVADAEVERIVKGDVIHYRAKILSWKATIAEVRFTNAVAKVFESEIEKAINVELKNGATQLRDTANQALEKAYYDGKLSLED